MLLLNRRQYPEIKRGYLVDKEYGYGIVSRQSEPGSAVLNQGEMVGLVTKIGGVKLQDYCMFTYWKDIRNLLKRLQNNNLTPFLGMSVKNSDKGTGAFVLRITSDSPLAKHLHLGDVITKVNGEQVRVAADLLRLIAYSEKQVNITATYEDKERTFTVEL